MGIEQVRFFFSSSGSLKSSNFSYFLLTFYCFIVLGFDQPQEGIHICMNHGGGLE